MSIHQLDITAATQNHVGMGERSPAFPLRLRDARLRALVREVAEREGISQNELIEHAIEDEMLIRGRLLADELQASADRLAAMTDHAYAEIVARSEREFAEGEGRPDPLASAALHGAGARRRVQAAPELAADVDKLGVLAAFEAGRR